MPPTPATSCSAFVERPPLVARWRRCEYLEAARSGAVQVETPDAPLNVLANGWLVYQTLACRLWARSGYYQSGGAFGFRDQLQDVMALVHTRAGASCASICFAARAASSSKATCSTGGIRRRGAGVRTHCSDDYLWLPFATCRYVQATGDTGVLDEAFRSSMGAR